MNPLLGYGLVGLGVLLLTSLAGNAYLWHEHDKSIENVAKAEQLYQGVLTAASACTSAVDGLKTEEAMRGKALEAAMSRIAPTVIRDQNASMNALRATADDTKDLCGSLVRYWRGEIKRDREVLSEQPQEVKP